jgi:hypothetical protein
MGLHRGHEPEPLGRSSTGRHQSRRKPSVRTAHCLGENVQ